MYVKIKDVIKMNRLHKKIEKALKKVDKNVYKDICLNNNYLFNIFCMFYDFSHSKKVSDYKIPLKKFCDAYKLNKNLSGEEIAKIFLENK